MEAATLFAVGALRGIQVACALVVTDVLTGGRERISPAALLEAGQAVGRLGAQALAIEPAQR
jgi:uridine phosphorylase